MEFVQDLQLQLRKELDKITERSVDIVDTARDCCQAIEATLLQLKDFIVSYSFADAKEEIHFFKHVKPAFYHQLIYFIQLFDIETNRPQGSARAQEKYLNKRLARIRRDFNENKTFCKYYRSAATYLDEAYFTREKFDLSVGLNYGYLDYDRRFCTSHDYKASVLMANELLAKYLNAELEKQRTNQLSNLSAEPSPGLLHWADTKASIIELLYGLQSLGVFYNPRTRSKADIRQVASFFEQAFNIDLGNYYRTFQEIRIRKKGRTAFLDQLKERLIQRMDETDENYR